MQQKLDRWGYCMVKIALPYLQPCSTDPPVRRTDGRTMAYRRYSILSRINTIDIGEEKHAYFHESWGRKIKGEEKFSILKHIYFIVFL